MLVRNPLWPSYLLHFEVELANHISQDSTAALARHRHSASLAGRGESLDEGNCDGRQLIGRGLPAPPTVRRLEAVADSIAAAQPAEWDQEAIDGSSVLMYHQAHTLPIPSMQTVMSSG